MDDRIFFFSALLQSSMSTIYYCCNSLDMYIKRDEDIYIINQPLKMLIRFYVAGKKSYICY